MGTRDPRIDAYIAGSAEFARPVLSHLREAVHAACADVEETMKWSFPHFVHHGNLCSMASFKLHCAFGFPKAELISGLPEGGTGGPMGQFGRITAISDLPSPAKLADYITQAVRLNEAGTKAPRKTAGVATPSARIPDDFAKALAGNKRAHTAFGNFSASQRKEYIEWITGAKRDETRQSRLSTAMEWIAEGKPRHWKYIK